jgi:hypothetical protein
LTVAWRSCLGISIVGAERHLQAAQRHAVGRRRFAFPGVVDAVHAIVVQAVGALVNSITPSRTCLSTVLVDAVMLVVKRPQLDVTN